MYNSIKRVFREMLHEPKETEHAHGLESPFMDRIFRVLKRKCVSSGGLCGKELTKD